MQCIDALTEGKPLVGFWRDRSLEYEADRRGKEVDPETFIEQYTLELDPLPCWRHLPKEEIQRRISEMVEEIDAESARRVVLNAEISPSNSLRAAFRQPGRSYQPTLDCHVAARDRPGHLDRTQGRL